MVGANRKVLIRTEEAECCRAVGGELGGGGYGDRYGDVVSLDVLEGERTTTKKLARPARYGRRQTSRGCVLIGLSVGLV